jgi:8-oxo-dGTP pyrophosphatase MutT (NUDIX family)
MADLRRHRPDASAGGVVLAGQRVLLLYKRLNGEWRLPKGRLDAGEDAAAAALREVAEETGFGHLTILRELGTRDVSYRLAAGLETRQITFFEMALTSFARIERDPKDAQRFAVCWMAVGQALVELTFEDERQWLRQALDGR